MTTLVVHAPFAGWLGPLDSAPDRAFAEGLVGPGVVIDPTETRVLAPFDGEVVGLPASRHAVTLRSPEGVEVLIHVGLDTVGLQGAGFTAHVREGDRVGAGDLLLSLDLDRIAEGALSLVSPIVAVNGSGAVEPLEPGRPVVAGEPILRITPAAAARGAAEGPGLERVLHPDLPQGLHARPAARIVACVRAFHAQVRLRHDQRETDAASLVGLMSLGLKRGDPLHVTASGPQAAEALTALEALVAQGLESASRPEASAEPDALRGPAETVRAEDGELILGGVMAAPGLAVGRAVRLRPAEIDVPEQGAGVAQERAALAAALKEVRRRIAAEAAGAGDAHRRAILAAHQAFLDDPALIAAAEQSVGEGRSAGYGWRMATRAAADVFHSLGDPRMAERADDLRDLEQRVLMEIAGVEPRTPRIGAGGVVIAEDLLPSQLMALDGQGLAGLCTARGGPTSHVAILAAAMGVPALVAVGPALDHVEEGALVVLDADGRRLIAGPSAARQAEVQAAMASRERRRAEARAEAHAPCHTEDGVRIEVFANLGEVSEAAQAVAAGAEGCGLLRTEFLFLDRDTAPSEDEQRACYQAIADALDGRPFIIRTLDAGGDKPLAYLPLPAEENPALGLRGVRSGLYRPDLLTTQLRAICQVRSRGPVGVMLPMVASVEEVRQARTLLQRAAVDLGLEAPLLGVMIETPAAAVVADRLAAEVDFVSIGTNDLTQYVLAMDRQNPALAVQLDPLHPAVLRLIARTAEGAEGLRWIGLCGGVASDPTAAAILLGLGVRELSVVPAMVAEIKARVRSLDLAACRTLALAALDQDSAEAVRALVADPPPGLSEPRLMGAPS